MMDVANALFHLTAAWFVVLNAVDILLKKTVAGHTYPSTIFFFLWGVFCVFYFWELDQWWTMWANVAMALANAWLLALVFKYRS